MPAVASEGETNIMKRRFLSALSSRLNNRWPLWHALAVLALFAACTGNSFGSTIIEGTVGPPGKYLVTGAQVSTTTAAVLKISFENQTAGTNLALCIGTAADFAAAKCPANLSNTGDAGLVVLAIVDTPALNGKYIYVIR